MARKIGSPYKLDLAGRIFGEWTVTSEKHGYSYICLCSCGNKFLIQSQTLLRGDSKSCGCKGKDWCRRHGMEGTKTYNIWSGVKRRCLKKDSSNYHLYGALGITVCDRWLDFVNFFEDMGECPEGYSLDRINVNGNYEASNCRWATISEQARNKKNTIYLEYKGERKPMSEWAEIMGIKRKVLENRIRVGWDIMKALETPSRNKR